MEAEMAYCTDDIEGARMAFKRALDLEPEVTFIFIFFNFISCMIQLCGKCSYDGEQNSATACLYDFVNVSIDVC